MKEFLQYIFYSGICLSIFWLVYRFLLSNITFYQFNRVYLLVGLMLSFVLPAFVITYDVLLPATITEHESVTQTVIQSTDYNWLNIWSVTSGIYLLGILVVFFRNLRSYIEMYRLAKKGNKLTYNGYKVIYNQSVDSPFTLFDRIFMNTRNLSEVEKELILKHEIVHINQKHWLDLVCSECALMLQWFNPLIWLYVSSIKENHEFQADNAVLAGGISPAKYQAVLINQRFQGPVFSFANSFSLTNKSNRLSMIKKEKSKSWKRAAVLAVLPLLGMFFWASAKPHYVLDVKSTESHSQVVEVNDTVAKKKISVHILNNNGENTEKVVVHDLSGKDSNNVVVHLVGKPATENNVVSANSDSTKVFVVSKSDNKDKLYIVVDGKEFNEDLNTIKPDDIDRIDVLKGQSGIEAYGEKGKNGVLKITLKKKK